jgi:Tfp pilus assembly protein PilF
MNKINSAKTATSAWQKTASTFLGFILSLMLLEAGLRLGGFIFSSLQASENLRSTKQKGVYRILCLGESSTQRQYPHLLEQVLNQRNIGVRFSVIDKGKGGTNTDFILGQVESYLAEYHPDMVVAMMGINDKGVKYYEDIRESDTWLFKHSRVYRFGRLLVMHLLKKIKHEGIYGSSGSDPDKKAIEINPKNDRAWVGLGWLYKGKGQVKLSQDEDSFKKAIELDPKNDEAYVGLGFFYQQRGKLSQAEDSFKKAIEINPRNDRAWVCLGWLYKGKGQGKFPQAEDSFKKAIEINPKNELAYVELGQFYQVEGEFSKAGDSFKKAIEINPKNDEAYVGLGFFYNQRGKFSQAEDSFKKASELNPGNDRAFFELGWLCRTQGKWLQAVDFFKKDMELHPNDGRVLSATASLYEELGQQELAKEYAKKAKLLGSGLNAAVTVKNYLKLKKILDRKGIKLVCVPYPLRNVDPLKKIFDKDKGVIFVDNERVFKEAMRKGSYKEYFRDMYAGDFGHCTPMGNILIAQNIADVILKEVFNK